VSCCFVLLSLPTWSCTALLSTKVLSTWSLHRVASTSQFHGLRVARVYLTHAYAVARPWTRQAKGHLQPLCRPILGPLTRRGPYNSTVYSSPRYRSQETRGQRPGPLHTLGLSIVNHPLGQSPVFNLLYLLPLGFTTPLHNQPPPPHSRARSVVSVLTSTRSVCDPNAALSAVDRVAIRRHSKYGPPAKDVGLSRTTSREHRTHALRRPIRTGEGTDSLLFLSRTSRGSVHFRYRPRTRATRLCSMRIRI